VELEVAMRKSPKKQEKKPAEPQSKLLEFLADRARRRESKIDATQLQWARPDILFDGSDVAAKPIREAVAARGADPSKPPPAKGKIKPNLERRPGDTRDYSLAEAAHIMHRSTDTARNIFNNEPGVQKLVQPAKNGKRKYTTMTIPVEVFNRVRARMASC